MGFLVPKGFRAFLETGPGLHVSHIIGRGAQLLLTLKKTVTEPSVLPSGSEQITTIC